ncbi:MAG: PEGA domain-containing protein [Deltaproteobacteria bacterium]|nr:PEGA domain-containing protein [Deltaproteobacteria bacterium]
MSRYKPTKIPLIIPLALACTGAVLLPQAGHADARTHFRRGEAAYEQANYEIAIQEWQKAYKLEKKPRIQHNLALAYERLGRLEQAEAALEIFLKSADPDDPAYGEATARLNSIKQRLALTGIKIICRIEGALIHVDGREWGRTPRPDKISVSPGSHDVVIRHPSYGQFVSNVVVPAGQVVEVKVRMKSKQNGETIDASESLDAAVQGVDADGSKSDFAGLQLESNNGSPERVSADAGARSVDLLENPTFWYLLSGGLALGAVGGVIWTSNRHQQLEGCNDTETYFCRNEDEVRSEQGGAFLMTTVLTAGAIGALVYAVVLDASDDANESARHERSLSARCAFSPLAARCGLKF